MANSALLHGRVNPRSPVIVGVGQFLNRVDRGAEALEPSRLMVEAARLAAADAGVTQLVERLELIAAVPTISWRYRDPGRIVAAALGANDARTWYATVGGNTPQMLLNRICNSIATGDLDLALLCGAEAGRSRGLARREGRSLNWTRQDESVEPDWTDDSPFFMGHPADAARKIVMPLQIYPLFENSIWHHSGRTRSEHLRTIGEVWSGFSRVAADNEFAWRREYFTAEQIVTPTQENRLLGTPYTKRMVSNPDVDMASAAVVCSAEKARDLGIEPDRWVFVHSGTDTKDRSISERSDFHSSPAIRAGGKRSLELAGVGIDAVAHIDLYSCYPSAVQIAAGELQVGLDRQLTVYGGLAFAGGPWNNPVGHAIAAMVNVLREDEGSYGLITANGGNVDKHAFGVYSTVPPSDGFLYDSPQDRVDSTAHRSAVVDFTGVAEMETWTVMHDRDSKAERAHAAFLTPAGERTWAVTDDQAVMSVMETTDMTGSRASIDGQGNFALQ